ncbi:hypothetical protein B0H39_003787 [Clostridium beijerinckii]|uniref:hypothetical protein n=1 Tax=Clostridium beijerinckii TaxID=1520 RepID=UPI0014949252|nr:hypothetical protein [Clostridium beijerinckii]NOW85906.1 hypothetical protein [Clostridium beijerinckii]
MSLELVKKAGIGYPKLEELVIEKIGDGSKDVFIAENNYTQELISNDLLGISSSLKLGEYEIDGVKVKRKLGFVYLTSDQDRFSRIFSVIPSLKYSKGDTTRTSSEYIKIYNQYNLLVGRDGHSNYSLIAVSYTEAL